MQLIYLLLSFKVEFDPHPLLEPVRIYECFNCYNTAKVTQSVLGQNQISLPLITLPVPYPICLHLHEKELHQAEPSQPTEK